MFCNSSSLKVGDEREKEREKERERKRERERAMLAVVPLKDARRVYCYRCYDACARVL